MIFVLFEQLHESRGIKGLLTRNGYEVAQVCSTGGQLLEAAEEYPGGLVVCGFRYPDMTYAELREELPSSFELLLLAPSDRIHEREAEGVVSLPMPLNMTDFLSTVSMMEQEHGYVRREKARPVPGLRRVPRLPQAPKAEGTSFKDERPKRSEGDRRMIDQVKSLLIERNHMTEPEAHRYLQKYSMDNGMGLAEAARLILSLM